MLKRKHLLALTGIVAALLLALALMPGPVSAGTVTSGTYTLTWPDYSNENPLISCEPWNDPTANTITVSGLDGVDVWVDFFFVDPTSSALVSTTSEQFANVSGELTVPIPYPDVSSWPLLASGERAIEVSALVQISPLSNLVKLRAAKFTVICPSTPPPPPPPPDGDGCTPGYWRQDQHFDSWVGYSPSDDFETVFGVDASFDPHTLFDAVWLGGGGEEALARHAVAALLNATSPDVDYEYTADEVIAMVQEAYATGDFEGTKDLFEAANETFCPLD